MHQVYILLQLLTFNTRGLFNLKTNYTSYVKTVWCFDVMVVSLIENQMLPNACIKYVSYSSLSRPHDHPPKVSSAKLQIYGMGGSLQLLVMSNFNPLRWTRIHV